MVECARLESVCRATYRGFESLPLRQFSPLKRSIRWLGCPVDVANLEWPRPLSSSSQNPRIPPGRSFFASPVGSTVSASAKTFRPAPTPSPSARPEMFSAPVGNRHPHRPPPASPPSSSTMPRRLSVVSPKSPSPCPFTPITPSPTTARPSVRSPTTKPRPPTSLPKNRSTSAGCSPCACSKTSASGSKTSTRLSLRRAALLAQNFCSRSALSFR